MSKEKQQIFTNLKNVKDKTAYETTKETEPRKHTQSASLKDPLSEEYTSSQYQIKLNEYPLVLNFSANWLHWELWRLEYFWVLYQGWRCFMDLPPQDGRDLTAVAVGKDAL